MAKHEYKSFNAGGVKFRCGDYLYESSLGRVFAHAYVKRGFVILSSNKNLDPEVEAKRYRELKAKIRALGYGFIELLGVWKNPETGEAYYEQSLMVPFREKGAAGNDFDEFVNRLVDIAKGYKQDSIIIGDVDSIYLYYLSSGVKEYKGGFRVDTLENAYSELTKGSHAGRKFEFVGVRVASNVGEALAMEREGSITKVTWFVPETGSVYNFGGM